MLLSYINIHMYVLCTINHQKKSIELFRMFDLRIKFFNLITKMQTTKVNNYEEKGINQIFIIVNQIIHVHFGSIKICCEKFY